MAALKQSIKNRIHLGLDLKGGTHLVLEVHVDEAVASATDRDVARLRTDLQKAGITGATVGKTRPGAAADDRGDGNSAGEAERCARRSCRATTTPSTTWRRRPTATRR